MLGNAIAEDRGTEWSRFQRSGAAAAEYEQWKKDEQKWQQKWGSLLQKQTETESKKSEAEGKLHLLRIKVQEYEAAWRNWINEHGSEREAGAIQRYEEACNSSASTWQKIQNWEGSWKGQQTPARQPVQQAAINAAKIEYRSKFYRRTSRRSRTRITIGCLKRSNT